MTDYGALINNQQRLYGELKRRSMHTPDLKDLLEDDEHLVFVYCHLKSGLKNNPYFLNDAKYLGKAYTLEHAFELKKSITFPIMFRSRQMKELPLSAKSVYGEAYAVKVDHLLKMDALMSQGQLYNREKIYCVFEEQPTVFKNKKQKLARECWVYMGNWDVWKNAQLTFTTNLIAHGKSFWSFFASDNKTVDRQLN